MLKTQGGTKTETTYTLTNALLKAEDILGANRVWRNINPTQRYFLVKFFLKSEIPSIDAINAMKAMASYDVEELNRFLTENGFSIQLDRLSDGEFGVVSILDLLVKWLNVGIETEINVKGTTYPAVEIKRPGVQFHLSEANGFESPVASLYTQDLKNPDEPGKVQVHMAIMENVPDGFAMVELAQSLTKMDRYCSDYDKVIFPMVDLDISGKIDWLIGMETTDEKNQEWFIRQALQQTKFRMNEEGVLVQDSVAISVMRCAIEIPKKPLVIDKPFLIWFSMEGLSYPLFTGYICLDVWKKPRDINQK